MLCPFLSMALLQNITAIMRIIEGYTAVDMVESYVIPLICGSLLVVLVTVKPPCAWTGMRQ